MPRSKPLADHVRGALRALAHAWWQAVRGARLAVGIPDYDTYLTHLSRHHPEREPMSREAFHRERMDARYGRGRSRCC